MLTPPCVYVQVVIILSPPSLRFQELPFAVVIKKIICYIWESVNFVSKGNFMLHTAYQISKNKVFVFFGIHLYTLLYDEDRIQISKPYNYFVLMNTMMKLHIKEHSWVTFH